MSSQSAICAAQQQCAGPHLNARQSGFQVGAGSLAQGLPQQLQQNFHPGFAVLVGILLIRRLALALLVLSENT